MSPEQAKKSVSMAMPVLMGAMAKNASNGKGAESLNNALDQHDGNVLDNLDIASLLHSEDGKKIVGHLLGSKRQIAEKAIAKEAGVNTDQISKILKIVGPILMGAISKEKSAKGLDLSGLTSLLSKEKKSALADSGIQSMIFNFIDQDNDGSIVDDLLGMAGKFFRNKK